VVQSEALWQADGTLQSGYNHTVSFLSENSKIKTNETPTAQTADHSMTVNS
jgi:hypothetical protein